MPVIGGNAIDHGAALAGQLADFQMRNIVSKLNTHTANIPVGTGVVYDGEQGAIPPLAASTAGDFMGVVVRELNRVNTTNENIVENIDRDMSIMIAGTIWVRVVAAVTVNQPAFCVVADGVNKGLFSNAAGSGATAAVAIGHGKFQTSAAAGGLAKLAIHTGG